MDTPSRNAYLKRSRSSFDEMGSFKIIHTDPDNDNDAEDPTRSPIKKNVISEYKIVYNEIRQSNRHKTPSGVWKYFAMASKHTSTAAGAAENAVVEEPDDRILCMLCYSKGRVHVYKSKTSSSNLWKHLNRKHDIEIPTDKICVISASNFDGYVFSERDVEEETSSNDYTMSGLDDNKDGIIKSDDLEQIEEYQKVDVMQSMITIEEDEQNVQTISKYDVCLSNAVHNDIGLAIIEEVAKRPILYQVQSSKQSSVRASRDLMWAEIYEALGEVIQIERIQKIWKNIRDRYRKIRNHEREGVECVPKYKYYDYLSFLDDNYDDPLRTQTSSTVFDESPDKKPNTEDFSFLIEQTDGILTAVDDLVQSDSNYTTEDVISETSNCTVSSSNPPPITATIYPMEDHPPNSENTENSPEKRHTPSPTSPPPPPPPTTASSSVSNIVTEQMDEFDLFGKLIANKLRSAPKDRVNLIEVKIMQAILENL